MKINRSDIDFTDVYAAMKKWASKPAKRERVAALLTRPPFFSHPRYQLDKLAPMPNRHPDSTKHFRVLTSDAMAKLGPRYNDIIGWIHTHVDGSCAPSFEDIRAMPDHYFGVVAYPLTGNFVIYTKYGVIGQSIFGQL